MRYHNIGLSPGWWKSLRSFVLHDLEALQHALPGFGRQTPTGQSAGVILELRRGLVEKLQLLEITFAPYADEIMQPHLEPNAQGRPLFQRLRREP